MKRIIKFRVWDSKMKRFCCGGPFLLTDIRRGWGITDDAYVTDNHPSDPDFTSLDDLSNTIQQFTGLLDKNGKEIYEGDVLRFENQEGVWPEQVNVNIVVKYPFICGNAHLGEIIGNIFES